MRSVKHLAAVVSAAVLSLNIAGCSKGNITALDPSGITGAKGDAGTGSDFSPDGGTSSSDAGTSFPGEPGTQPDAGTQGGGEDGPVADAPSIGGGPAVPWGALRAPAHPQILFDQARLDELRQARTTAPYATMHAFASAFLDWNANRGDNGGGAGSSFAQVGGYATLAEIEQKNVDSAIKYLDTFCKATWSNDADLSVATQLISAALAYDVLFHEPGFSAIEATCKAKIVQAARSLYSSSTGGMWWNSDYLNNHNWHNNAALGVAGLLLRGDATYDAEAAKWRAQTDADFAIISRTEALISDGSWHEGAVYGTFGLESQMYYWIGAERAGGHPGDDNAFVRNWGHYLLEIQQPNHPRFNTLTSGDWVWARPGTVATLKYVARRFSDPYAQEAAARWDLEGRSPGAYTWLGRYDFANDYALEYAVYDPTVPTLGSRIVSVPKDYYNEDQGSYVMRSSWSTGTSGLDAQTVVVTLKNGYVGGKGNALALRDCATSPIGMLNAGHDHMDDFSLYIYGKGGWLLPEATGYNCCGTGTSSDPNAYQNTVWHNSVTFDGRGQLGDDKVSANSDGVVCGGSHPWFYTRSASMPIHLASAHFSVGQADGTGLYPASLGLARALRTVVLDRETTAIALADDFAFTEGTSRVVQQHFHSMRGASSGVNGAWLHLDNGTSGGATVPVSDTVLGVQVIAPTNAAKSVSIQSSNAYQEWMSPDGAYGHAVVATAAAVSGARFLELLWPTTSAGWDSRPSASALDAGAPQNGMKVPLPTGDESFILNTSGATTDAGGLRIEGARPSDLAVVRMDAEGGFSRLMLEAVASGRLLDQGGARTLLDLGGNTGMLEVAFDGAGGVELSGTSGVVGIRFFAPSEPTRVTRRGASVGFSYDHTAHLVTISG